MICEINTIVIAIYFLNEKKLICALMSIIRNHYGKKCLSILLQLEPCSVMFKVISDKGMICEIKLVLQ